ncbi:hypothetical protein FF011L_01450 [Roseimaritima multifibrata]|uniref:DUF6876 domain-containing protein n=1 Tax=Roseimaritima multifibrata TaxID=1930274 RepID=A0A517M951_9BACT|nr:DUF6876 family protein [Roseimaritima multifibrata]QDS91415.1 hypothetical protein FF011L_01450 [Roseimaritima multifibrata]
MTITSSFSKADLQQFTGDDLRYRTLNRSVIYTPGIKYLAENAQAYWLIDAIASYFVGPEMRNAMKRDDRLQSLQFWRLEVTDEQTASLYAVADKGLKPFIAQAIDFTDFPFDCIDVWAGFDGTYWTLYLPSEH